MWQKILFTFDYKSGYLTIKNPIFIILLILNNILIFQTIELNIHELLLFRLTNEFFFILA
jgi:hypothetical protein